MKRRGRSLLAQNAIVLVALFVLAQFIAIGGHIALVQLPRLDELAQAAGLYAGTLELALAQLDEPQRQVLAATLAERAERPVILFDRPETGDQLALRPLARLLLLGVDRRFSERETLISDDLATLWVELHAGDRPAWLAVPFGAASLRTFGSWLWVVLLGGVIGLGGALFVSSRINRPLRELAAAAAVAARGERSARMSETGPSEIVAVRRGFNQMLGELEAYERNRAIVLAGISHDLRTPITRLRLWLEVAGGKLDAETTARMIGNLEAMDRIIGQFTAFARTETDEPLAEMDLTAVLDRVARETKLAGRPVAWPGGPVHILRGRPLSLQRAVTNLIDNSFVHGAKEVSLTLAATAEDARITVADDGPGIPEALLDVVRQPFRQLEPGQAKGTVWASPSSSALPGCMAGTCCWQTGRRVGSPPQSCCRDKGASGAEVHDPSTPFSGRVEPRLLPLPPFNQLRQPC